MIHFAVANKAMADSLHEYIVMPNSAQSFHHICEFAESQSQQHAAE
jgi:hypothetical protein